MNTITLLVPFTTDRPTGGDQTLLHPLTLISPPGARPVKVLTNGSALRAFPEEVELEEDATVAEAESAEDTAVAFDAESEDDAAVAEVESEEDTAVALDAESEEEDVTVAFDVESEEDATVAEAESADETDDP